MTRKNLSLFFVLIVSSGIMHSADMNHSKNPIHYFINEHGFHAISGIFSTLLLKKQIDQMHTLPKYDWQYTQCFFGVTTLISLCHQLNKIKSADDLNLSWQTVGTALKEVIAPSLCGLSADLGLQYYLYNDPCKAVGFGSFCTLFAALVAYKIGDQLNPHVEPVAENP